MRCRGSPPLAVGCCCCCQRGQPRALYAASAATDACRCAGQLRSSADAFALQGMARVWSGQAPWPLSTDRSVRTGSGVKRDFACTLTGAVPPVLVALQAQSRLGLEGRIRTLSGPSPDLRRTRDSCTWLPTSRASPWAGRPISNRGCGCVRSGFHRTDGGCRAGCGMVEHGGRPTSWSRGVGRQPRDQGQDPKTNSLPLTIALPLTCFVWHQPAIPDDAWR
jgi:hypothetical protein